MLILRDFNCKICGRTFEDCVDNSETTSICACGHKAEYIITKIAVHGCDSFSPHYDEQVGQYFESPDHKAKILEKMGMVQRSGPDSPRNSNLTSIKMTKDQARKHDPYMGERIKDRQNELAEKKE